MWETISARHESNGYAHCGLWGLVCLFLFSSPLSSANSILPNAITITAVDTLQPESIGKTHAVLSGAISLDQPYDSVVYYFQYGLTTAYTDVTPSDVRRGDNTSTSTVTGYIDKLNCGESYHARLVTELTLAGEVTVVNGNDVVFRLGDCGGIELFPAEVVSRTAERATIYSSVIANGAEISFYFQYGDTLDMLSITSERSQTGASIQQDITGLVCGTKYYFQLFITSAIGDAQSDVISFSTNACPAMPTYTTFYTDSITLDSVTLIAEVTANGAETSVLFEYGPTDALGSATVTLKADASAENRAVSIPLSGLLCGAMYFYKPTIANEIGSISGAVQNFTTSPCVIENPIVLDPVGNRLFAGASHSIVIGASGELVSWGDNEFGQLGGDTVAVSVVDVIRESTSIDEDLLFDYQLASVGATHTIILHRSDSDDSDTVNNGTIATFGNNERGQLGVPLETVSTSIPQPVFDINDNRIIDIVDVAAGGAHNVAVKKDGSVWVWGDNTFGQLTNNEAEMSNIATAVEGLINAVQVTSGRNFSIVLLGDKTLKGWGQNDDGQLGADTTALQLTPIAVENVSDVVIVEAGVNHVLALNDNGQVLSWGKNDGGQLGLDDKESRQQAEVIESELLVDVVQLAAGEKHSLALLSNGSVVGWGDNSLYQLGLSDMTTALTPVVISDSSGAPLRNIAHIAAGDNFSVAMTNDGRILTWGDNSKGQLSGRVTLQSRRATLTNAANAPVNMDQPRLLVSDNNIRLKEGEVAHVNVWLTEDPIQNINVRSSVGLDTGLSFQAGEVFEFTSDNWFQKYTITIAAETGAKTQSELVVQAPGLSSVRIGVNVSKSDAAPAKQAIGSVQYIFLNLLMFFLIYFRLNSINVGKKL